jgi:small subunit ribosomal protein S17
MATEQATATAGNGPEREPRRRQEKVGVVVSAKMQKTVVVEVERLVMHPLYQKYLRRRSRFMAHDEKGECRPGDQVTIRETRPMSRHKRWIVQSIMVRAGAK